MGSAGAWQAEINGNAAKSEDVGRRIVSYREAQTRVFGASKVQRAVG